MPPAMQPRVRRLVQFGFRTPSKALDVIRDRDVFTLLKLVIDEAKQPTSPTMGRRVMKSPAPAAAGAPTSDRGESASAPSSAPSSATSSAQSWVAWARSMPSNLSALASSGAEVAASAWSSTTRTVTGVPTFLLSIIAALVEVSAGEGGAAGSAAFWKDVEAAAAEDKRAEGVSTFRLDEAEAATPAPRVRGILDVRHGGLVKPRD